MSERPNDPVELQIDFSGTSAGSSVWTGEGWAEFLGVPPFFWSGSDVPPLHREGSRFWIRERGQTWRLAAILLEDTEDFDGLDKLLANVQLPVALWLRGRTFLSTGKIRDTGAVGTIVAEDVTDTVDLSLLKRFPHLHALYLDCPQCSDLSPVRDMRELRALYLSRLSPQASIEPLRGMSSLRDLVLQYAGDCDLRVLADLPSLESLELEFPKDEDIATVASACPRLRRLICSNSLELRDLAPLARLKSLRVLKVHWTPATDFRALESLTKLESLNLCGNGELRDLAPVVSMPRLTHLDLSGCAKVADFGALQHMPHLRWLSLPYTVDGDQLRVVTSACPKLERLDIEVGGLDELDARTISGLLTLRHLDVRRPIRNADALQGLKRLEVARLKFADDCRELSFRWCFRSMRQLAMELNGIVADRAVFVPLQTLRSLNLSCERLDAAVLAPLRMLVDASLYVSDEILNPDRLTELVSLTSLTISGLRNGKLWNVARNSNLLRLTISNSDISDVSGLTDAPQLRGLDFESCGDLAELSALARLPRLRSLSFNNCKLKGDLSPLGDAPQLRSLVLNYPDNWLADDNIWAVGGMRTLTDLSISLSIDSNGQFTNLRPLAELRLLENLSLTGCAGLADLSPLERLPLLRILWLGGSDDLTDLMPLGRIASLRSIVLSRCGSLADLSPLEKLPQLRSLSLADCDSIVDFGPLERMPHLTSLEIVGSGLHNISFLRRMKSLRQLTLSECRNIHDTAPLDHIRAMGCHVEISDREREWDEILKEIDLLKSK